MDMNKKILTIKEASEFLGVHPCTLRNWEKQGLIKPIRIGHGRHRRYTKDILTDCVE